MSTIPLDHVHDVSGRETHRLTTLFAPPDFVKNASEAQRAPNSEMPRHLYADPLNKLYPCHTAAATWLSAVYFADKAAEFKPADASAIRTRIHDSAQYFGILGQVYAVEKKAAADQTRGVDELNDADFAIVWVAENGSKDRHWPLRNAPEVKFAAAHFEKFRDEFVFTDRHVIANKILEKAAAYNADINEQVHMLSLSAGYGACAAKVAGEMLRERAALVRRSNAAAGQELSKLASAVDANPDAARTQDMRLKIAAAVDAFDRENKLERLYGSGGLERPEEILFAVTEKAARDFMSNNVETTTGNVYAIDDLEKLAVEEVRNWLGDDFADAVSSGGVYMDRDKIAAIVPTLDRGMAGMLDRLMQEKKIAAVVQTKAASDMLPLEKLYELAQADNA
jgi:hypothetical protein